MMRSLYSGISGLRNHQTRMDVIGNNIANVNTTGYKTSRVVFQDIFSQTAAGGTASAPGIGLGGTNPIQIGLGIKLASVDVLHTPAPFGRTDNPTDMMIGGDGFFIVETPDGYLYTRAGNFKIDDEGYLVTTNGYFVMGYGVPGFPTIEELNDGFDEDGDPIPFDPPRYGVVVDEIFNKKTGDMNPDAVLSRIQLKAYHPDYDPETYDPADWPEPGDADYTGPPWSDLVGFTVGQNGEVTVIANNRKLTISMMAVAMFSNPSGLEKAGNSFYRESSSSGQSVVCLPTQNGAGTIEGGGLEMSNVDLASEFTDMIVTQRGFQANSRVITVSDTMLEELVNLKR